MFLITCPVTRTDELVVRPAASDRSTNHPTHIAMHVACPPAAPTHVTAPAAAGQPPDGGAAAEELVPA